VPLQGFLCPLDENRVNIDFCIKGCVSRCMELPILLSLMEEREKVPGVFSATELQKPPRITAWERANPYWIDPYSMIWATFGTAFHAMIEKYGRQLQKIDNGEHYTFEKDNYFEKEMVVAGEKVILRGTPDQYEWTRQELTDYKTLKWFWDLYYLMKGDWTSSNYALQLNIYRRMMFPDCKQMKIVALVKDWNRKIRNEKGIKPVETLLVPWIDDDVIDAHIYNSIAGILEATKDITKARDCTEAERWKGNLRCKEFCVVAGGCPQWEKLKEEK